MLYQALLSDLLDRLEPLRDELSIEILWTADGDVTGAELRRSFRDFELARQAGEDLGERMQMAFSERIFFHEAEKVVAIGVDDPSIDEATVRNAFALLESCEWIIAPAEDGGYRMIGCRGGAFRSAVFRDVSWGSATVFAKTLRALRAMKKTLAILPCRRDIDDVDDLRILHDGGELSPRVQAVAQKLSGGGSS